MVERRIRRRLQPITARLRRLWFSTLLAIVWMVLAALGLAIAIFAERANASPVLTPLGLAVIAFIALVLTYVYAWRCARDYRRVVHRVERFYPELNARLLTAIEQQPSNEEGLYSFLQETVIREALYHDHRYPWYRAVPGNRLLLAYVACFASLLLVCTASWRLWHAARPLAGETARAGLQLFIPGTASRFQVDPGDVEVERGSNVLVTVRFQSAPPPELNLVAEGSNNEQRIRMTRSLDDPLFGARLETIEESLTYHVEFEEGRSRDFHINVFEFPRLERVDAQLNYPSYTSLPTKQLTDVRRITAVEGTQLHLTCYMNKPLAAATMVASSGQPILLKRENEESFAYVAELKLDHSERFEFHLTDEQGRTHKLPPAELAIQVTPNQPPDLKWLAPGRDSRVSPLEELLTAGTVFDDFGVVRHGLSYRHNQHDPVDIVLGENRAGGERHSFQHTVLLESLQAEPDELLSYHLWAEDIGPDGQPRHVASDMYFAEVRPFEEIFREGQPQPDGGSQQQAGSAAGQQAEELAELQKQIINGTWNILRRETKQTVSQEFQPDVQVLNESQSSALEQLGKLGAEVRDPKSIAHLDAARQAMQTATEKLTAAGQEKDKELLNQALAAEQTAYQSLLRLRAREHEVVRSNQSASASSASGSSSRAQQELQQLQLNDDQNRYETERTAQTQDPMQREMRQALNRLRELARRQGDLNERVKEVQSALEQAKTEDERKELESQLKRLREEQQEILRDTEELQQRLDQPSTQEQLSEQREQLAETRENVRQASEALEEGRLSQAVTSGTRAERDLKELQEEFRRRSSNQFSEQMRDMRDQAQQMSEQQKQIGERLDQLVNKESQSLRPSEERQQLEQSLAEQRQRVDQLLESMRDTVQEAELDEPLLSRKLYDTYRQTQQDKPQEALQQAAQWMQQGFPDQAQQPEQLARASIQRLADGVEEAARGILGDETEALRRARSELDELAEQLAQEMDRQNPQADSSQSSQPSANAPTQPARADNARQSQPASNDAAGQPGESNEDQQTEPSESGASSSRQNQSGSPNNQRQNNQQGNPQSEQSQQGQSSQQQQQQQQQQESSEGSPLDNSQSTNSQPSSQSQGSQREEGEQSGQQQGNQSQANSQQGNQQPGGNQDGDASAQSQSLEGAPLTDNPRRSAADGLGGSSGPGGQEEWTDRMVDILENNGSQQLAAPLTGDDYRDWSDRLRDVEEILNDPELRAQASQIRERAREMRVEFKRHSKEPAWDLVRAELQQPLVELRNRVAEELRRREGGKELAPVDRDPVPAEFEEHVRRYYEQLGSGTK